MSRSYRFEISNVKVLIVTVTYYYFFIIYNLKKAMQTLFLGARNIFSCDGVSKYIHIRIFS